MKKGLIGFLSFAAVLIIVLAVIPQFFDLNQYKGTIVSQIEKATGYSVDIAGNINLSLLPAPAAQVEGLSVRSPIAQSEEPLLRLKRANVGVSLLPLLQKKVVVEQITLIEPVIYAEKLQNGTFSWQIQPKTGENSVNDAKTSPKSNAVGDAFSFDKIVIENGQLTFTDIAAQKTYAVQALNAQLKADTLNGPFKASGKGRYQDMDFGFEGETKALFDEAGAFPVQMEVTLDHGRAGFSGAVDPKTAEIQGQGFFETDSLQKLAQALKVQMDDSMDKSLSLKGALKAGKDSAEIKSLELNANGSVMTGEAAVSDLQAKNPVMLALRLASEGVVNVDEWLPRGAKKTAESGKEASGAPKDKAAGSPVPETLELPLAINADISLQMAAVRLGGQNYKGVSARAQKDGPKFAVKTVVKEAPGETQADFTGQLSYASASTSKTGSVVYADPTLSFVAQGGVGSVHKLADAYNIQLNDNARSINAAKFDVKGKLSQDRIELSDSVVTLDKTTASVSGYYKPNAHGRDKVSVELNADTVDFDQFIPQKKAQQKASDMQTVDAGEALKPVQQFELPVDADFDISIQQAVYQGEPVKGVRLEGSLVGKNLKLKQAGVNSYKGASVSVSGDVADLAALSGLNLSGYARVADVKEVAKMLGQPTDKLPQGLSGAELSATAKGDIAALNVAANIKAMQGQLDVKGNVADALNKPQISNVQMGVKHPNFVQAMQIVNPEFKAGSGLAQPIDVFANINQKGNLYELTGIQGHFGPTSISGQVVANTGGSKPAIDGSLVLGSVPLDKFFGDDKAQAARAAKSSGSSNVKSSGERWSTRPINVNWINSADVDLDVQATSVDYGGWSFDNPKTKVTMGGGKLNIQELKAGLFGGQAVVNTTLQTLENGLSVNASSSLDNVGVESLVYAMSGSNRLQARGTASMTMNVNAAGASAHDLVNTLAGNAKLNGRDVVMQGFDLAKLARALSADLKPGDSVQALLRGVQGGTTQFDTIDGHYAIDKGVVGITSMVMDGPAARIDSSGSASLPRWYLDTKHKITLKEAAADVPPFEISIAGPLDNPGNTFGKGILQDYLQRKIQRKVAKEAEKLIGDKLDGELGGALEKLGILGGGQKQAPAQQPQQNTQPASDSQPQEQQAPAQQKQPESSPEEQLIRGVLDGLLQ